MEMRCTGIFMNFPVQTRCLFVFFFPSNLFRVPFLHHEQQKRPTDAGGIAGSCADELDGYLARLPPNRGNQRAVEHNIDIYALAGAPLCGVNVGKSWKTRGYGIDSCSGTRR